MKTYTFIFEDKAKNELTRKEYKFRNIKEARIHAEKLRAESMLSDLHKIRVRLKKSY